MTSLFGATGRQRLTQFAAEGRVLLAFDFDGTLAPIVRFPHRARARAETRALLRRLTRRYPTVIISSRGLDDLRERVAGTGIARVIGDHGADGGPRTAGLAAQVHRWRGRLHDGIAHIAGAVAEDKRLSVSVHYDDASHPRHARAAIARLARRLGPVRIVEEHHLTHILPAKAPNKAIALDRERARVRASRAIYVGDEMTDEVVFQRRDPSVLSVRVGLRATSAAEFYLRDQRQIDRLLRALIEMRG